MCHDKVVRPTARQPARRKLAGNSIIRLIRLNLASLSDDVDNVPDVSVGGILRKAFPAIGRLMSRADYTCNEGIKLLGKSKRLERARERSLGRKAETDGLSQTRKISVIMHALSARSLTMYQKWHPLSDAWSCPINCVPAVLRELSRLLKLERAECARARYRAPGTKWKQTDYGGQVERSAIDEAYSRHFVSTSADAEPYPLDPTERKRGR